MPQGQRLVDRTSPMVPSQAQPRKGTWPHPPVGPPPAGGTVGVGAMCAGWWPRAETLANQSWLQRLVTGTWNITSLAGKEPELVREVERYQLDMVSLLDRGWTLSQNGISVVRGGGLGWVF